MSRLSEWLAEGLLISDGAWGTELQARGLPPGAIPDTWNLTHPERVEAVARAYVEAGSQVILTNTFRANAVAMHGVAEDDLDAINRAGVALSRRAAQEALVFASIGPTGKVLVSGEIASEEVTAAFAAQAQSLAAAGADALLMETMSDIEEACLAVAAARRTGLPVLVSFAFDSGKNKDRTMMGATPESRCRGHGGSGRGCGGRKLRRGSGRGGARLPKAARGLRSSHLDQAQRGTADNGRDGHSLWHIRGVLRIALRGPARCGRLVSGRLLRLDAGVHSRPGGGAARRMKAPCSPISQKQNLRNVEPGGNH